MAIPHAGPGEPVDVFSPAGAPPALTTTLIKTESLEVIRLVMPVGKEFARHQVSGEITLQCLTGSATLQLDGQSCELSAGKMTYLSGGQGHSLLAREDSSLLLTILLSPKSS
jgi:quercetin dioxygenase-like cupin family protein